MDIIDVLFNGFIFFILVVFEVVVIVGLTNMFCGYFNIVGLFWWIIALVFFVFLNSLFGGLWGLLQ